MEGFLEHGNALITPIRDKSILRSKFATAYMFGKDMNKVVVMNTTKEPLLIKKGTRVDELHPRENEDMTLRSNARCDSVASDSRDNTYASKSFHNYGVVPAPQAEGPADDLVPAKPAEGPEQSFAT